MRALRTGTVAAVVLALVVGAAWGGYWYAVDRQRRHVALPAANATPAQVVTAYVRALDAHDRATAEALAVPGAWIDTDAWLAQTASIRNLRITAVEYDADYAAEAGPRFATAYTVNTSFDYHSHWWSSDAAFPDGHQPYWSYTVVRCDGRWLIRDDGQG